MLNDNAQLLIIILAIVLIVFLVMASLVALKAWQVMNNIKRIAEHAEQMVQNMEDTTAFFKKAAGPMTLLKFVGNIVDFVGTKSKRSKER